MYSVYSVYIRYINTDAPRNYVNLLFVLWDFSNARRSFLIPGSRQIAYNSNYRMRCDILHKKGVGVGFGFWLFCTTNKRM